MMTLATFIQTSAHQLDGIADGSVQAIVTSPPYYGLRAYAGDQAIEWPAVEYAPMPGLPPIRIAGCEPGCEHEWVSSVRPAKSGGVASAKVQIKGQDNFQIVPAGEHLHCSKCGGWRGGLGNEPTLEAYIGHLILCLREWRKKLRDDGCCFVNLGDSFSNSTIFPESYIMREDISFKEKCYVAMEMFGVRLDGYEPESERALQELLQASLCEESTRTRSRLEVARRQEDVSEAQGELCGSSTQEESRFEMARNRKIGRKVRMLRGNNVRVFDRRPYQWRRGGTPENINGQEPSEFDNDLPGYSRSGIPEGQVSGVVFQLQLLDRVLGILSTHAYAEHKIPDSVRKSFDRRIALKPKDLMLVPARFALAAQADGWWLRNDLIWTKPNPMPESVTDRFTRSHEHIFMLTKSARYFFDSAAIAEPSIRAGDVQTFGGAKARNGQENGGDPRNGHRTDANSQWGKAIETPATRNHRDVLTIATSPFPGSHFAVWPEAIPEKLIRAATSERGACAHCGAPWVRVVERTDEIAASAKGSRFDRGKTGVNGNGRVQEGERYEKVAVGWQPSCACPSHEPTPCVVLDPFSGSGTTAKVAVRLGRRAIGVDVSAEYLGDVTAARFGDGVQMELVAP